jgi:hypothetical protein
MNPHPAKLKFSVATSKFEKDEGITGYKCML